MKKLLTILLVLTATVASAQLDNSMGIFFSEDTFIPETTNFDPIAAPFEAYVVLLCPTMVAIGAYEVGIEISDPAVFILGATGPNGWTNFGDNLNHLCGYGAPLPTNYNGVVLSSMTMLYTQGQLVEITFGPSQPSSVDGWGPAVADGVDPDILYVCNYTSGPDQGGLVATLNGEGIGGGGHPAVEARSFSNVKSLFDQ